jgi:glyceraldehyde-3-phosphate dehydrogenase/erythrose-4-phosphate dehydrogenase
MNVLVRGLGNIGTTLANLLLEHRQLLGIDLVLAHKQRALPYFHADLELLRERGAHIYTGADASEPALARADYVFDCRQAGAARADRPFYEHAPHIQAVCAQGSETGFGPPFVSGINPQVIAGAPLVQVASCNTHALATLTRAFAGPDLGRLVRADFVIARRSEDLGNHERLVSGTVVARHRDPHAGTHHAEDATRLFATIGCRPRMTSSDVTTPSQLLHTIRFALELAQPMSPETTHAAITSQPRLARTEKFDGNRIFELGRRYGTQGRLYSHAIVVANNLLIDGHELKGWAFVPQEGNTILSTLDAFLLQTRHAHRDTIIQALEHRLLRPLW